MTPANGALTARAFGLLDDLLRDADGISLAVADDVQPDGGYDARWLVAAGEQVTPLIVQAYRRFTPRDVATAFGKASPAVRAGLGDGPSLVVAPWLSARSRGLLAGANMNYVDLTGNVRLNLSRPTVLLRLDGERNDPNPPVKAPVRLQGASVNALVRVLAETDPPYRMIDLARATGLSNGYVSRTLEALDEERLIERSGNKAVTSVDWSALLRARAENYDLLRSNRSQTYIARSGARSVYDGLSGVDDVVVTGSFAAARLVQVAAPSQLVVYAVDPDAFARAQGLLPATTGDVVVLSPADPSQVDRRRQVPDGSWHVGISQLAVDCLAGNGRLPEEGEALLEWMTELPSNWRATRLPGRR